MGQPPHDGEARDRVVRVRCLSAQAATWQAAADEAGVDLSTWIRDALDDAAAKAARDRK
jgi:hypothetical protein